MLEKTTLAKLADVALVTPQTMHRLVVGLERRELVHRNQRAGDRKSIYLSLTSAGADVLSRAEAILKAEQEVLRQTFNVQELDVLFGFLQRFEAAFQRPESGTPNMQRRGVCYDVGRYLYGDDWRKDYNPQTVHRELEIIRDDLHCNAVRICSKDLGRLTVASEDALRLGLEVWFSPELWNKSPETTLAYTAKAAEIAENLRRQYPDKLVMSVGSELTLFMKGIIPGGSLLSRMRHAFRDGDVKAGKHNEPLNDYLSSVVNSVRQVYQGPITYASLPFEDVNWEPFDVIGIDHYRS